MARHLIDKFNDTIAVALLRDGKHVGRILARFSKNPNGSVCHALVQFDANNKWISCTGKAGGYGYDKFSTAVSSALSSVDMLPKHDMPEEPFYSWTFRNAKESDATKDARDVFAKKLEEMARTGNVEFVPVYSGTGNVEQAFRAVGFDYVRIL